MFFANATYIDSKLNTTQIALCTDIKTEKKWQDQNTDDFYRLCYIAEETGEYRPIAKAIMITAANDILPAEFKCLDKWYTLVKYTYTSDERIYNEFRKNHVLRKERVEKKKEIYVCTERCRCTRCFSKYGFDNIVNICGIVPTLYDSRKTAEIDLQKCTRCLTYFIDRESLSAYEAEYGLLNIFKHHITGNGGNTANDQTRDSYTYKPDTALSRNGYFTRLYTNERRRILNRIIESGESSKSEVKDILTRFIGQRGWRQPNACAIWKSDLEYVNNYNLQNQDRVVFE